MVVGMKYHVVFKQQGGNYRWYTKEFIGVYMGLQAYNNEYVFSLRPAAGTGNVPVDNVVDMERTEDAVYIPRSVR